MSTPCGPGSQPSRWSTRAGRWRSSTGPVGRRSPIPSSTPSATTTGRRTRTTADRSPRRSAPTRSSSRRMRRSPISSMPRARPRSSSATMQPGDELVVTGLDHEANVGPWLGAAADRGLVVRTAGIRAEDATLDLEAFDALLHGRPKLVAFGWASNAVGTINPVAELVRRAHEAGALTYVDAVHAAPHLPIDVQAVGTDFLACSVYKFFGPHVGVLYGRAEALDALPTYKLRPADDRFETGTLNHEGIAGSLAAVEYVAEVGERYGTPFEASFTNMTGRQLHAHAGMAAIRSYEMALFGRLMDGLEAIPGARLWGITDRARFEERTPTAAVTFEGHSPEHVATALGSLGIAT